MKWLSNLILWILSFWTKIPEQTREKIVEIISETFRTLLEKFYDWIKSHESKKKEKESDKSKHPESETNKNN